MAAQRKREEARYHHQDPKEEGATLCRIAWQRHFAARPGMKVCAYCKERLQLSFAETEVRRHE